MKGIQNYFKSPLFCFHGDCGKVCPTDIDFFGLISFHYMWMLFLSSFINFCSFLRCFMKFNPSFFISMATAAMFVLPIPIFLAYLIPLDVDVTGNITSKICEVWSEFNIFLHLGYHGNGHHFEFFKPPKSCHTLRWIFLQRLMKFDERNQKKIKSPLFLFSWQLRQSLPNGFRFFWFISFH